MLGWDWDAKVCVEQAATMTMEKQTMNEDVPLTIFNRRYIFKWLVFHCRVSWLFGGVSHIKKC